MSWREALLSLQVMAEQGYGSAERLAILQAKAKEDADAEAAVAGLQGMAP